MSFSFFFSLNGHYVDHVSFAMSAIQSQIHRELAINNNVSTRDRCVALQIARTQKNQLVFVDVDWGKQELQDGVEDVYTFFGEEGSECVAESAELPTGITTMLTRCYSASCGEGIVCYSYTCTRKVCSLVYR